MSKDFYADGKLIDVTESVLAHPTHADGLVDSGDPVTIGTSKLGGVAQVSAENSTEKVAVRVPGGPVVKVNVRGEDAAGNAAIAEGDFVYLDTDLEVNKDATNGSKFGVALEAVGSGITALIPVKLVEP